MKAAPRWKPAFVPEIFVPDERGAGETRVAATPATTERLVRLGHAVSVQSGAGAAAGHTDAVYREAGAAIADDPEAAWARADVVLVVGPPSPEAAERLAEGATLIGLLAPARNLDTVRVLARRGVNALALELVPRISRAQGMDALTSQANLAGYRAAIVAASSAPCSFPLFMTAAGTLRPATVVVLGAGVAGLQAIATARRLGALVRANDIRPAAAEEVRSLGAEFIDTTSEAGQAEGGYARAASASELSAQQEVLAAHIAEADAVICTAVVPGKPAPTLVPAEMVERMSPGAVIVDLAAAEGGNCALTDPDGEVDHHGVRIIPAADLPRSLPGEASSLYARNQQAVVQLLTGDDGALVLDTDDAIVDAALLTAGGEVRHGPTAEQLGEREHA